MARQIVEFCHTKTKVMMELGCSELDDVVSEKRDGDVPMILMSNLFTLLWTNKAMENGPFEDDFPIENGDIPLLC